MNDRTLFDVDRTTTTQCPSCLEVRQPDQDKVKTCPYDSWEEYIGRRPKGCLNAHDPAHAPFPEGF